MWREGNFNCVYNVCKHFAFTGILAYIISECNHKMRHEPMRQYVFFLSKRNFIRAFNNAANIFKYLEKYFNVFKALADFLFCLVGYIWPKSIKDDAVLAMIKRSGLRYQIFCVVVFSFFLSKENAVLYYYYYRQIYIF